MVKLAPQLVREYIKEKDLDLNELWLISSPGLEEEVIKRAEDAAFGYGVKKVTWVKTGGVITTHGGPGAFGVVGFMKA